MKVEIDHISFAYKEVKALNDISLEIESGDLVTVLGPNGSGKSTLLKCIDSILKVTQGEIRFDGVPQHKYGSRELSRHIAYIPQSESSTMELNVFDTILMGRKPYIDWNAGEEDWCIVEEIIHKFQLEELAFRNLSTLSGGQKQRVYIARAMAQQPKILLLDEPTANLDIYHQLKVMELLKELSKQGMVVILTEHDLNLATRYATKVLMLRDHKVFNYGEPSIFSEENIEQLYDIKAAVVRFENQLFIIPKNVAK
ncbi:MAG: ABC transporter ATP-binding protein [Bacteroidales bacterium]